MLISISHDEVFTSLASSNSQFKTQRYSIYDDVKPKAEKKLTFEELAFFKATDFSHSST